MKKHFFPPPNIQSLSSFSACHRINEFLPFCLCGINIGLLPHLNMCSSYEHYIPGRHSRTLVIAWVYSSVPGRPGRHPRMTRPTSRDNHDNPGLFHVVLGSSGMLSWSSQDVILVILDLFWSHMTSLCHPGTSVSSWNQSVSSWDFNVILEPVSVVLELQCHPGTSLCRPGMSSWSS